MRLLYNAWQLWCCVTITIGCIVTVALTYCGPLFILYLIWRALR